MVDYQRAVLIKILKCYLFQETTKPTKITISKVKQINGALEDNYLCDGDLDQHSSASLNHAGWIDKNMNKIYSQ